MFLFLSSWERFMQYFLQVADQGDKAKGRYAHTTKNGSRNGWPKKQAKETFHVP